MLIDLAFREVLCQEALRSIVGDNFLWSASSDTAEGALGEGSSISKEKSASWFSTLANRMLHNSTFPCIFILAHHDSQAKVQFKSSHYSGKTRNFLFQSMCRWKWFLSDSDECLAEILNGVQIADRTLQFNRLVREDLFRLEFDREILFLFSERRDNRSSRDRLLEEQNQAYLESVRADQEKAEQRKREEIERKQFEEDQRRAEEEKNRKLQVKSSIWRKRR